MDKIIKFEQPDLNTKLMVTTNIGFYVGKFAGYTELNGEKCIAIDECKIYPLKKSFEKTEIIDLGAAYVLLHQIVSVTVGINLTESR